MAILQVRDIDDRIYEHLKRTAKQNRRSISQEVVHIIETYLSESHTLRKNSTEEFLKLAGSWKDERTAEDIIMDIRKSRTENKRFAKENVLFD
jgi:plasmid stability protein